MAQKGIRPWTELVKLHPDVEAGALTEAVFAIDLGAIAEKDPNVPVVYRDPEAFFKATYLTADMRRLLEEVLASLAGKAGYNRVLKLRTPFGGGKSHTLAALLHAACSRKALKTIPEAKGFADPGTVKVAVFDGEKFSATGKKVKTSSGDEKTIQTMWGWIAWQFGEEKFKLVEDHDRKRVSLGGDEIKELLKGGPKLILLDEVLKYMERSAAVAVLDSTLQRQTKDFFQNLTVEVSGSKNCALVYSLTWSSREALGNVALLQEIDHLASRVDQSREPVSGDEILYVLQKRLLSAAPPEDACREVSEAYSEIVTNMMCALAETSSARKQADEDGLALRNRMRVAYPFHPALIDAMKERWCSLDEFQRTRGALRFLASCLHALKKEGGARALLGPGEVPLKNAEVRVKMLKELGAQNDFDAVILADVVGPNARAKRIDDRMAQETPAMSGVKPATRLATAIFIFSFGGLKRGGDKDSETLPPGVTEGELLAACVGPDLDSTTARAVLGELKNACLYLHYDGVHYCFKKDPNVTKLIEDAEKEVARHQEEVTVRIKEMLTQRLAGHHDAVVWPTDSRAVSDEEPRFLVGYLPLEFARGTRADQEKQAVEIFSNYGNKPRKFRNGIGLAIPDKKQIESLRRAVRYIMAVERVDSKKSQHRLSKEQQDQLKEQRRTWEAAAESGFRSLYNAVWLPRVENGGLGIEAVEVGGRPLQATGVHERIMELLTKAGTPKVHSTVTARKVADRVRLGEGGVVCIKTAEVVEAFYRDIAPPRLESMKAICSAIAKGVGEGMFGYGSGNVPAVMGDGKAQVSREKVVIGRQVSEDEIDLEAGWLIWPSALPEPLVSGQPGKPFEEPGMPPAGPVPGAPDEPARPIGGFRNSVSIRFRATRDQVFKAFQAIANLADRSDEGKVTIQVDGISEKGYDSAWLRNAVEEPLDEADVEKE
ncbi:MAG: AAA family ATPase [Deltaproteobacteria bacterium RBG_13_61_14]|nr:MAG: AAA family ATPase [Deltaproteobacteria bacterium RBG_13_61_14]